jgi:hypothetical protein
LKTLIEFYIYVSKQYGGISHLYLAREEDTKYLLLTNFEHSTYSLRRYFEDGDYRCSTIKCNLIDYYTTLVLFFENQTIVDYQDESISFNLKDKF